MNDTLRSIKEVNVDERREIIGLHVHGMSSGEIAKRQKLNHSSVGRMIKSYERNELEGVPNPKGRLAQLKSLINDNHAEVISHGRRLIVHAIACGDYLHEAKSHDDIGQGDWIPWLDINFKGSYQTANVYMKLAKNRELIESAMENDGRPGELSLRGALSLIKSHQREEQEREAEDRRAKDSEELAHSKYAKFMKSFTMEDLVALSDKDFGDLQDFIRKAVAIRSGKSLPEHDAGNSRGDI